MAGSLGDTTAQRRFPNPVVTFLPLSGSSTLLIQRRQDERNFPGLWAFPGGKVELGETFIDAMVRELYEETGLTPVGRLVFLDTYHFARSVGVAFAVEVRSTKIESRAFDNHVWLSSQRELQRFHRVPGIDNHFLALQRCLRSREQWPTIAQLNLTPDVYVNT